MKMEYTVLKHILIRGINMDSLFTNEIIENINMGRYLLAIESLKFKLEENETLNNHDLYNEW